MTIKLTCVTKEAKQNYAVVLKCAMIIIGPIIIVYGLWELAGMFGEVPNAYRTLCVVATTIVLVAILAIDVAYENAAAHPLIGTDQENDCVSVTICVMLMAGLLPYTIYAAGWYVGCYQESPLPSLVGFIIAIGVVVPLACAVSKCRYQKKSEADE